MRAAGVNDGLELGLLGPSRGLAFFFFGVFFYFILHIKIAALCSNERKMLRFQPCLAEAKMFRNYAKDTAHKSIQDITGLF